MHSRRTGKCLKTRHLNNTASRGPVTVVFIRYVLDSGKQQFTAPVLPIPVGAGRLVSIDPGGGGYDAPA